MSKLFHMRLAHAVTFAIMVITLLSQPLSIAAEPSPDFDGDGVVGIPDFLLFVDVFGSKDGQENYDAKYDLDGNEEIGIPDFLIFVDNFGKMVPPFSPTSPETETLGAYQIYWVDRPEGKIQRSDLNGNLVQDIVTELRVPGAIAIAGSKMYWTLGEDSNAPEVPGKIQRSDLEGSNVEDLVTGLDSPFGIAISGDKMYWTDDGTVKIQRADLDGSNVEDLVTNSDGLDSPVGIAISGDKIYWTDNGTDKIQRADLDGSNVKDLITTGLDNPFAIAIGGGKMYLVDRGSNTVDAKIQRADLDGSNVEDLVTTKLNSPTGIALNITGDKMYWVDRGTQKLKSAKLNGKDDTVLVSGLNAPTGIVLNFGEDGSPVATGVIAAQDITEGTDGMVDVADYFIDPDNNPLTYSASSSDESIATADILGSVVTVTVVAPGRATITVTASDGSSSAEQNIVVNVTRLASIYWVDRPEGKIQRADLSGNNVEDIVTGLDDPVAIAIAGDEIYWTDNGPAAPNTGKIQRLDLNSGNVEDLVTGLSFPFGIAIAGGKIYWTDYGTDKIQRADLDGSNVEDLVTYTDGLDTPFGIAIAGGKMYWTDNGPAVPYTGKIQRANLNGSKVEDLITGLDNPFGIAISGTKMYWTDRGSRRASPKIQRANTELGEDETTRIVEDLVTTGLGSPTGIALDIAEKKMYWVDRGTQKVHIAKLNGKFVDELVTGLNTPTGIVLDFGGANASNRDNTTPINDKSPSSPPSNFLIIPSYNSLWVHYAAVPDEPKKPLVRGYHAEIRLGEDGPWGNRQTIYGRNNTSFYYDEVEVSRYHKSRLINGQLYQVRVRAWNSEGASGWSEPVSGKPVDDLPEVIPRTALVQFQDADGVASAEIDLSLFTSEGGRILITRPALPANISEKRVQGVFAEIAEVAVSKAPDLPRKAKAGFTIPGGSSLFDINLKARVNGRNVDIGDALSEPAEICLPVPANISDPLIVHYDEGQGAWEILDMPHMIGNAICAFTDRFSLFAVGRTFDPPVQVEKAKFMYWVDRSDQKIQRADFSGNLVQDIVTGLDEPGTIAIAGGKMYWTDNGPTPSENTGKIQRADLDGSNAEDLVTGLGKPFGIAISGDKIYWTDNGTDKIQRADLDGSNVEDLITTGLDNPFAIAIGGGKMYLVDRGSNTVDAKIQRADLDGSNVEDLVTTQLDQPMGIALNITGDKMYWTDQGTQKIKRAKLNGNNAKVLVSGLNKPTGIALYIEE